MQNFLICLSVILTLISPIVYTNSILKRQARPHRTTRLVLLVTTLTTTFSLLEQKDSVAIWLSAIATLQAITIFSLSIKYGMGGWSKFDISSLVIAMFGIAMWSITDDSRLALFFAIFADLIGMLPTLIKTFNLPQTENYLFFLLDTCAGFLNLLAIRSWKTEAYTFPLYILLINLVMTLLIVWPRKNSEL